MNALRQSTVNGEPTVGHRRRLAADYDDGLYRYVPVPPVFRDAAYRPCAPAVTGCYAVGSASTCLRARAR